MRLELRQISGEPVRAGAEGWSFERGRRTLGRGADCDWQAPDSRRLVSKLHCTIERDRNGFILRDQSANGSSVDGVVLREGDTARLRDQSRIEFGECAFTVRISGEADLELDDPDARLALSDEPLTISSILADIAPGGRTGNGILGRRDADAWTDVVAPRREPAGKSSRNVEIGWDGPPAIETATRPILPDDWNDDFDNSNRYEHQAATHVPVPLGRPRRKPMLETDIAETAPVPDGTASAVSLPVAAASVPGAPSAMLRQLEQLLDRMAEAIDGAYSTFDLDPPVPGEESDFLADDREGALTRRFNGLIERQVDFNDRLQRLVRETSRMLEPRTLEARVDAEPRRLPWLSDRSYWQAYRAQFERENRQLSLLEFFRDAMLEHGESHPSADTTGRTGPKT
ncbi:FHA domain-containing protein [Ensifer sp. BR816]|uniref:FHA domain-containing protein n=1 Tax=Rhizobium sp. (strain BR816) TaxID=1057002 RepID=UPI00037F3246|nr:FHA domain-containing protein [Ensifer sp. BR816]